MEKLYNKSKMCRIKMEGGFNSFIDTYLKDEYMGKVIELEFRKFFRIKGFCLLPTPMSNTGKSVSFYR